MGTFERGASGWVRITLDLDVTSFDDVDETGPTGLTEAAYARLLGALESAGFTVVYGPRFVATRRDSAHREVL